MAHLILNKLGLLKSATVFIPEPDYSLIHGGFLTSRIANFMKFN